MLRRSKSPVEKQNVLFVCRRYTTFTKR